MMDRRKALKVLSMTPVAGAISANSLADCILVEAHGGLRGQAIDAAQGTCIGNGHHEGFVSFADWLTGGGEDQIREQASRIEGMDAEIMLMHVPMTTKVRMQRNRNYKRIKAEKKRLADMALSLGNRIHKFL